ncbi:hypothetical protein KEM52_005143, partial [Ascosphaera acerosa]
MCLGWCASNSVVFGDYVLRAASVPVERWNQRLLGLACLTAAFAVQAAHVNWGLRLTNALGVLKFAVVLVIFVGGAMALTGRVVVDGGDGGRDGGAGVGRPDNLAHPFRGSTPTTYGIVTALYSVVFSYIGYANANY